MRLGNLQGSIYFPLYNFQLANTIASSVQEIILLLKKELEGLGQSPQVLPQQLSNIRKYRDIIKQSTIQNNVSKKRAQDILSVVEKHSLELFVLYALITKQYILGIVK